MQDSKDMPVCREFALYSDLAVFSTENCSFHRLQPFKFICPSLFCSFFFCFFPSKSTCTLRVLTSVEFKFQSKIQFLILIYLSKFWNCRRCNKVIISSTFSVKVTLIVSELFQSTTCIKRILKIHKNYIHFSSLIAENFARNNDTNNCFFVIYSSTTLVAKMGFTVYQIWRWMC